MENAGVSARVLWFFGCNLTLVLVQIFFRDIIFRELPGSHLALIGIRRTLDSADGLRFGVLPFFQQLFHALGIDTLSSREPLCIAGLPARCRTEAAASARCNWVGDFTPAARSLLGR